MAGYSDRMNSEMEKADYHMDQIPLNIIYPYCCGDAITTYRLVKKFKDELYQQGIMELYEKIVAPAARVYQHMMKAGVKLDDNEIAKLKEEYSERVEALISYVGDSELCKEWKEKEGEEINLNSSKQMQKLLYEYGKIPVQKNKKTNKPSTDEDARIAILNLPNNSKFEKGKEVCKRMMKYSKVKTLNNTFVQKTTNWIHDDGLVHPNFLVYGTVTGRLATRQPNTQNIPKEIPDDEWLAQHPIKRMFISKFPDGVLVSADYSQLELRLLACLSHDNIMIQTYKTSGDLHETSGRLLHPDYDLVTLDIRKKYRGDGKHFNFASAYSLDKEFMDMYPGLYDFVKETTEFLKKHKYVSNEFGRRRRLPEVASVVWKEKNHAIRQAVNFRIQSLGHDLLKRSLIKIEQKLIEENLKSHLVLDIHDALIVDSVPDEVPKVVKIIKESMEDMNDLEWVIIPFLTEVTVGPNWQDQKDIE